MSFVSLSRAVPALGAVLLGCTPAMDWREVRAGPVAAALPCRPSVYERRVPLAGVSAVWRLQACSAGGATWALGEADLADPALVTAALGQLLAAAAENTAGQRLRDEPWRMSGATPNPQARRISVRGTRPDGRAVEHHAVVFAVGTQVVQLSVVGDAVSPDDVDAMFGSARVPP